METPDNTCIYCSGTSPFSQEHVVPAGLGGDDRNWILKDCVCAECNTKVFSPLEAKFLRALHVAFARLFLQQQTRKDSRSGGRPSLQTTQTEIRDPVSGYQLETELEAGGKPVVLPQLLMLQPDQMRLTGGDEEALRDFVSGLGSLLTNEGSCPWVWCRSAGPRQGPRVIRRPRWTA